MVCRLPGAGMSGGAGVRFLRVPRAGYTLPPGGLAAIQGDLEMAD